MRVHARAACPPQRCAGWGGEVERRAAAVLGVWLSGCMVLLTEVGFMAHSNLRTDTCSLIFLTSGGWQLPQPNCLGPAYKLLSLSLEITERERSL